MSLEPAPLYLNANGPEPIRVIEAAGWYLVQTWSNRLGSWITQKEHKTFDAAQGDAATWYPPGSAPTSIACTIAEQAQHDPSRVHDLVRQYSGVNVDQDDEMAEYTFTDDGSVLTVHEGEIVSIEDSSLGIGE